MASNGKIRIAIGSNRQKYCLQCGESCTTMFHSFPVFEGVYPQGKQAYMDIRYIPREVHVIPEVRTFPLLCEGPFATCAPPEMTEEQWQVIFASEEAGSAS